MPLGSVCQPWPVELSTCGLPDGIGPDVIARWQAVASQILWALSGRRWGPCEVTVRPCRKSCLDGLTVDWTSSTGGWIPYIDATGVWRNASACGCVGDCSCGELCEVILPGPANAIVEVKVDGTVLDPEAYRLDTPNRLIRTDDGCWPDCQNMRAADTEEGTFSVTYDIGLPLDPAAIAAVSDLTAELIKSCLPNCECRLPQRVQSITRGGVSMSFVDPMKFLDAGRTGLYLVDLWLAAVNPKAAASTARVMSPDCPPVRGIR